MSDQYPTEREILEGKAGFPERAYHNGDGMYVMPDPEAVPDMIETTSGLYLPRPSMKQITRIVFDNGTPIDVSNSYDDVCATIDEWKSGDLVFKGPVFEGDPVLIRSSHVKAIRVITVDYRDLKEIEQQMKQHEFNLRMQTEALAREQAMNLARLSPSSNNRKRR